MPGPTQIHKQVGVPKQQRRKPLPPSLLSWRHNRKLNWIYNNPMLWMNFSFVSSWWSIVISWYVIATSSCLSLLLPVGSNMLPQISKTKFCCMLAVSRLLRRLWLLFPFTVIISTLKSYAPDLVLLQQDVRLAQLEKLIYGLVIERTNLVRENLWNPLSLSQSFMIKHSTNFNTCNQTMV